MLIKSSGVDQSDFRKVPKTTCNNTRLILMIIWLSAKDRRDCLVSLFCTHAISDCGRYKVLPTLFLKSNDPHLWKVQCLTAVS